MIRFAEMTCFLESGSSFLVRRAITCGTFDPNVYMIRFVGSPFVFTSRGAGRTDAGKLGWIRFVEITCFFHIQMLFFIRKAADSIVKVHTIRFVHLPFVFQSAAVRQTDAARQLPEHSRRRF